MTRDFNSLIEEADGYIAKKSEKGFSKTASSKEDIEKLAAKLVAGEAPQSEEESAIQTLNEKVAHSVALVDTLLNLGTLVKVAKLEQEAADRGIPHEKVANYIENNHSLKFRSVLDML